MTNPTATPFIAILETRIQEIKILLECDYDGKIENVQHYQDMMEELKGLKYQFMAVKS